MSDKESVSVVVDINEATQNPRLTEILVLHEDVETYTEEDLEDGDILIENCIFERKTPEDFASSISNGHLKDQVERMGGRDMKSFVMVEGNMEDFDSLDYGPPAKSCRGMDASIEMRNNIPVKYCSTSELLADMAIRLARKEKEEPVTVQTTSTDSTKDPTFMENFFLGIEGIGIESAQKLANQFKSVESALKVNKSDYQSIEGIGSKTSEKIHSAIHNKTEESEDIDSSDSSTEVYSV